MPIQRSLSEDERDAIKELAHQMMVDLFLYMKDRGLSDVDRSEVFWSVQKSCNID